MAFSPFWRKLAVAFHVASSVGLLGAIAGFLALAATAYNSEAEPMLQACYVAMDIDVRLVIVPLAFAALLTGVVQSLGTTWGLFQHYWVVVKLLLTLFATAVLLVKLPLIAEAARLASEVVLQRIALRLIGLQLLVHALGGMTVLLLPLALSMYKPRGLTRYGWRKRHTLQPQTSPVTNGT